MKTNLTYPPYQVLLGFGIEEEPCPLPGGIEGAHRAGEMVLKEIGDVDYYEWCCENILTRKIPGIRLQEPIRTNDGSWSVNGWIAYRYLAGSTLKGHLAQKLEISRLFHEGIKNAIFPNGSWAKRLDRWAVAERVVWEEEQFPSGIPADVTEKISKLLSGTRPISIKSQVVHSDLGGNILTDPGEDPAVIDLSLVFRPVTYAEAMLIYDVVVWQAGQIIEAEGWFSKGENLKFLSKACAFRLLVTALCATETQSNAFSNEWMEAAQHFGPILGTLKY